MKSPLNISRMTILEVLVAMAILMIIMSFLASMVFRVQQVSSTQQKQADLYEEQRLLMDVVARDLSGLVVNNSGNEEIYCSFQDYKSTSGADDGFEYAAFFVTNSGLGVRVGEDTSTLLEVSYCLGKDDPLTLLPDTPLYRNIVRPKNGAVGNPEWDFKGVTTYNADNVTDWANYYGGASVQSDILAIGVDTFMIEAFWTDGTTTAPGPAAPRGEAPSMISVTAKLLDKSHSDLNQNNPTFSYRTFIKRIIINRGN